MPKINLETLSQKAKKKKDFIIIILIFSILSFIFISIGMAFMDTDKKDVFKERVDVEKDKKFQIVKESDFKENWALAVENRVDEEAKKREQFQQEMKADSKKNIDDIKNLILEQNTINNNKITELSNSLNNSINSLKNNVESKLAEQQNQIEDIGLNKGNSNNSNSNNNDEPIVLGQDLLPPLNKEKFYSNDKESEKRKSEIKQELDQIKKDSNPLSEEGDNFKKTRNNSSDNSDFEDKSKSSKFKLKMVDIDTATAKEEINKEEKELADLEKLALSKNNNFHLMTGLSQAYMITGAYAPAFDSGQEEPLPVLLQAEGDILIANDDTQTIDKCLLIGSAKGNMNSETADIRLVKISCSLGEGTKKIEGNISGWVIGENGIPGVQGELLHKNGAWLSKTFVSGFLETFASSLGNTNTTQITLGTNGTNSSTTVPVSTAVSDNAKSAAAGGLSTVFGKLGDYYLKMAEQIFPVIEVKGGRTVNILLKGGESFSVTDFNKLDLISVNDKIEEEKAVEERVGKTAYLKMKKQAKALSDEEKKSNANTEKESQDAPFSNSKSGYNNNLFKSSKNNGFSNGFNLEGRN